MFLVCLESSRQGGVHGWAWLHDIWTCGAKVLEYWMISSLKLKLNCSWKLRRTWNVHLVLMERSWWAGFNGIHLIRLGFRMWEMFDFSVISAAENSNEFQKTQVLEGKISWGRGNTWANNGTCHTSDDDIHFLQSTMLQAQREGV